MPDKCSSEAFVTINDKPFDVKEFVKREPKPHVMRLGKLRTVLGERIVTRLAAKKRHRDPLDEPARYLAGEIVAWDAERERIAGVSVCGETTTQPGKVSE